MASVQVSYSDDHMITVTPSSGYVTINGLELNYTLTSGVTSSVTSAVGTLTFNPATLNIERGSTATLVVMYTNTDPNENIYVEYPESEYYTVQIE